MKNKLAIGGLILIIAVLAASVVLGRGAAQDYAGQQWEYLFVSYDLDTGTAVVILADENASMELTNTLTTLHLPRLIDPAEPTPSLAEEAIAAMGHIEPGQNNPRNVAVIFDYVGSQGWELSTNLGALFIFKRPMG